MAIRLGMPQACNVYSEAIDPQFCGVCRCASSLLSCGDTIPRSIIASHDRWKPCVTMVAHENAGLTVGRMPPVQVKRDWNKITGCESGREEAGYGPEARLGSRICHSSDGSLCDYGAVTSEGLIVRSFHRQCQFHHRVIQEAGSAPLPLSEDVVGLIGQDVSGAKHVLSMV